MARAMKAGDGLDKLLQHLRCSAALWRVQTIRLGREMGREAVELYTRLSQSRLI